MTIEQLEEQSRFRETEQVVLVGDGMGPPAVGPVGPAPGDDGDGE